jgi:GTP-binding protein EngB required for normal cell division
MKLGRRAKAPEVLARATALSEAIEAGRSHMPGPDVDRAETVVRRIDERLGLSGDHTVVALAGATGSGKSSLFNQIAGIELAIVGVRRPTTAETAACIWGTQGSSALMDWLRLPSRHRITRESALDAGRESDLQGLVLLDLPDYDSTTVEHGDEVDRLVALVDVFVWVTDPQKYADAALHERYLKPLAGHDTVTVVVLNQADRLSREAIEECRRDLVRLLAEDGLDVPNVLVTSALTGAGVPQLKALISQAVHSGVAVRERLAADLDDVSSSLKPTVADREADAAALPGEAPLVAALEQAAGITPVLDAVEEDYRRGALGSGGWPITRWARSLRPDPLRRLRLGGRAAKSSRGSDDAGGGIESLEVALRRTSLPAPTPAQRARVSLATRQLADAAGAGLPQSWVDSVQGAAAPPDADVSDALDQAVLGTDLGLDRPRWWLVVGALQWLLATAALLGLVWLIILGVSSWLGLPKIRTPDIGAIPVPTALLIGGLVLGFLLGLLTRFLAARRAAARRARARARLDDAVAVVARERIIAPVAEVLDAHRRTREALARALTH